jgi:hypothetical protein
MKIVVDICLLHLFVEMEIQVQQKNVMIEIKNLEMDVMRLVK